MATFTVKQFIERVKLFSQQHAMINSFLFGDVSEHLANKELLYPALLIDIRPGKVSVSRKESQHNFDFYICDLANVSKDTRKNEIDVINDLTLIAEDLIAMSNDWANQDDYTCGDEYNLDYAIGAGEDQQIFVKFSLQINTDFTQNNCQIPKRE